ncbi:MAG: S8 family serine peptidase [Myxococcales bacterium]|nr:S8 family serine peptidase [Myxococcales bacterium]
MRRHTAWSSAVLVLFLGACGGSPPAATLQLSVPEAVTAPPGAPTFLDVKLTGAAAEPVTLNASVGAPLSASASGLRVRLDVPKDAPAGASTLSLTASDASGATATASVRVEVPRPAKPPTRKATVSVELSAFFFADGDVAKVTVDLGGRPAPAQVGDVVLVASESHDVERLALTRRTDGRYESTAGVPVRASQASGAVQDGTLTLPAGGAFVAFFGVDTTQPGYEDLEATAYSDLAVLEGARPGAPASRVEPGLALTTDEEPLPAGARPVGTIFRVGDGPGAGAPLQLATHQLVLFHDGDAELNRFLAASGGTLVSTEEVDSGFASLVEVDPSSLTPARLAVVRALAGESGELLASRADAAAIYGLALAFRLDGFVVSVNPRLQYHSAPRLAEPEASTVTATMQLRGTAAETASCLPGSSARPCTTTVPALWTYLDLMELDSQRVKVAVLDMGFAPTADFRAGADGGIDQCDFTGRSMRCGPGVALGPPTVGASLVGPRVWHGTGVVTALGGVVDNGFGSAGVGGQLAVPMLYKYDLAAYAFEMGGGIRQALRQGAQVINISAGYPCTVVTSVGPDFDICSEAGRLGICGVVTAIAHTAAAAFCTSPLAAIPIVGQAVCGGLITAAVIATNACLSTLALGNVRSTMASAVNAATASGVPVVASAGNALPREAFPDVIRDYVNLSERRTEAWGIIPATLPGVLAIGAAEGPGLESVHFIGARVDVWAPSGSSFVSPDDASPGMTVIDEVNATSGAAPFVAGTVAAMQAANPSLDPSRATAAERATAVSRVRELLVSTAHSNATLAARGFTDDAQRRNVLDPLAAVLAAARGAQPDLGALGYDTTLNFSEADGDDDVEARARAMPFETRVAGTIFAFDSAPQDEDWYRFTVPVMSGRVFGSDVVVRWVGSDNPTLWTSGPLPPRVSETTAGAEHVATYRLVRASGAAVSLRVTSAVGLDVPYQVSVSTPVALTPTVRIEQPVLLPGQTVCANRPTSFRASVTYPDSAVTGSSVTWAVDGVAQGSTALTTSFSRPAGTYTFTASSFGGVDTKSVTFVDCAVAVEVTTPSANVMRFADGIDALAPYLNQVLTARALDAMGMVINPSTLVFEWVTNRGDLQPGGPATGEQLLGTGASLGTVRLYCAPGSTQETHVITVRVRASAGGPVLSTDSVQVVVQSLI